MKTAAAFQRDGKVYLHPYARTIQGLLVFSGPVVVMGLADDRIAAELLATLSRSLADVPHPTSWKGLTAPLLRAASMRSYEAFARTAKLVEVDLEGDEVSFRPTKNCGPRGGFFHLN